MRGRCRNAQPGRGQLPGQLLGRGVIIDIGGAGAGSGGPRSLGFAVERCLVLVGKGWACESNRGCERKRGEYGFVHSSLPVTRIITVPHHCIKLTTAEFQFYSPNWGFRAEKLWVD